MNFDRQVEQELDRLGLLSPSEPIIVGVSGGPDSLALAHVMMALGCQLEIAHFDHGLRRESGADAYFVQRMAAEWGVPFHLGRAESGQLERMGGSLEATARQARYAFLLRVATEVGARRVAVGHTLDDQAETVLMQFLRGSGPKGLAGMRPVRPLSSDVGGAIMLVRPLLTMRRQDTESYCRAHGLQPLRDPSNRDLDFLRNRVRHELLPTLERVQPNLSNVLSRSASVMRDLAEFVESHVKEAWQEVVLAEGRSTLAIDRGALCRQPAVVQGELVRAALDTFRPAGPQATFAEVERLRQQAAKGKPPRQDVAGGLRAEVSGEQLLLQRAHRSGLRKSGRQLGLDRKPLPQRGTVAIGTDWRVTVDRRSITQEERMKILSGSGRAGQWLATLDAGRIAGGLAVRSRRPGDRIRPLGMGGSVKLSDLFINEKVASGLRPSWPIVVDDEKVCWVPGLRLSADVAIEGTTTDIVELRVDKQDPLPGPMD